MSTKNILVSAEPAPVATLCLEGDCGVVCELFVGAYEDLESDVPRAIPKPTPSRYELVVSFTWASLRRTSCVKERDGGEIRNQEQYGEGGGGG